MISAKGGLPAHRYTPQVTQRWPRGSEPASTQTDTHPNTTARNGAEQPKREPKHTHPHRTPEPGVAAYTRSAHTHTHTPTPQPGLAGRSRNPSPSTHSHTAHPNQEWRGTSGARTQTHTHPKKPSHEWRGAAETQTHTHRATPHTPAWSCGVQAEHAQKNRHTRIPQPREAACSRNPSLKYTDPHRTPQTGVAGYKLGMHTDTNPPEHPSQE